MSWLIDTLVFTGALIALVLVLRRPVARHFGPGLAYALWLLPLLRLILPPLTLPAPAVSQAATTVILAASHTGKGPATGPAPALDPWPALVAVWLAGAALFLAWRLGGYFLLRRRTLRDAETLEWRNGVRIVATDGVPVPVAFGVADRIVALPRGFVDAGSATDRELALAHELEHHAGRDIAVNFAMQPLLALHWFNPLAWIGWRALRRDQEAACDARVLAGRDAATREAYGQLIARFARGPNSALAAPMACAVLTEKNIVHRLRSLTMTEPSPRRRLAGRLLIAAGVLALPLTASISYAAADDPVPPPTPAAPAGGHTRMEKRIVIVEKAGPTKDDSKLKTRVITRDGKTIVFKTDKVLSDAEIDKRVEEAMAKMPAMPDMPGMAEPEVRHRMIVKRMDLAGAPGDVAVDAETFEGTDCKGGEPTEVDESADADGQHHRIRIKICAKQYAADAIRKARDEVAQDKSIPEDVRTKVLKELDEELARNAKQG